MLKHSWTTTHIYQRDSDSYPNSSGYDVRKIITIQYVVHKRGLRELLGAAVLQKPVWRANSFRFKMSACFMGNLSMILYYSDAILRGLTYWQIQNQYITSELLTTWCLKLVTIGNSRKGGKKKTKKTLGRKICYSDASKQRKIIR